MFSKIKEFWEVVKDDYEMKMIILRVVPSNLGEISLG